MRQPSYLAARQVGRFKGQAVELQFRPDSQKPNCSATSWGFKMRDQLVCLSGLMQPFLGWVVILRRLDVEYGNQAGLDSSGFRRFQPPTGERANGGRLRAWSTAGNGEGSLRGVKPLQGAFRLTPLRYHRRIR